MKDIENRSDIELLINEFYKKVVKDKTIGYIFTEVVHLDWEKHIPVMYDFWETVLLDEIKYKGNPILKHIELDKKEALNPQHFSTWLALWEETLNDHFSGTKADEALQRAKSIGGLMMHKIETIRK